MRRAALLFAAAVLFAAAPVAAQEVLSPGQLRVAGEQAVLSGRPEAARRVAGALLARDADDVQALLILSRAERDLQDFEAARAAGRQAWARAGTEAERFAAAMAVAQALSSDGARTRAQLWLRRAMQVAPDDRAKAVAVRDFRYVRLRNPWSTRLAFSVAPSSNVNGGTSSETADLFLRDTPIGDLLLPGAVLGPSARALSGVELRSGLSTSYRLGWSEGRATYLDASLTHRTYRLSDAAKADAPDVEGSDFARTTASLGLRRDVTLGQGRAGLSFGADVQRDWYGGAALSQTWSASAALRYALTPALMARASLSRDIERGFGTRPDAAGWRASVGAARLFEGGHRISVSLAARENRSDAGILDYSEREAQVALDLGRPVLGTEMSFGLSAAAREHEDHAYSDDGRRDRRYGAWARMSFETMDAYGFVPDVTLRATRTESDLGLYDSEEIGLSVGIRSKF